MADAEARSFGIREHELAAQREQQERATPLLHPKEDLPDNHDDENDQTVDGTGAMLVNSMSYHAFRDRLVRHFEILHKQNEIRWPQKG